MGEPGRDGGAPGDLYIIITRIRPHEFFERIGDNLYCAIPVTAVEAALGAVDVPTIEGMASLTIPPGTQSGKQFRLRGKGVPHLKGGGAGDQYVTIQVTTPEDLTDEARETLETSRNCTRRAPGRKSTSAGSRDGRPGHDNRGVWTMNGDSKEISYLIGHVARMLGVHPQTLRIYEREGLLRPRRSERNTRVYSEIDVRRAELVLTLTRDLRNQSGRRRGHPPDAGADRADAGRPGALLSSFPDEARTALRRHLQDEKALVPVPPRRVINVEVERPRKPAAPKRKNAKPERGKEMRYDKMTVKVQEALHSAQGEADKRHHQQIDVEHLLAALLKQEEGVIPAILKKLGADPQRLARELETEVDRLPQVTGSGASDR